MCTSKSSYDPSKNAHKAGLNYFGQPMSESKAPDYSTLMGRTSNRRPKTKYSRPKR